MALGQGARGRGQDAASETVLQDVGAATEDEIEGRTLEAAAGSAEGHAMAGAGGEAAAAGGKQAAGSLVPF